MKIPLALRLSPEAIRLVKELAATKGVSQTAIIEMAVREMAKREKITVK